MRDTKGITLIALIITIIVLLILAGISITMLVGENGLIGKANWAKFVTEYGTVKEGKDLYEIEHIMEKETGKKENKKIATTGEIKGAKLSATNEETTNLQSRKYPIIENEKIENNNIVETLKETIKITENIEEITEEKVELYKVDMNLINIDIKNEYVINIKTGELYKLGGVKYQGKTYHRPDWGVTKNGEIEEGPEDTSDTIYLKIDEKKQLTTKLQNGEVEWSSSDESIVTVDQKGEITGIAKGQAIITISYKTEDTGEEPPEESEEGNGTEDGEEETVTNTANWRSEDENIVKIEKGKVQAIGIGTTKVIAEHQGETTIC